jgi:hypothetical protein
MYENIKSCVTNNGNYSVFFPCRIGVRQGENLSPFLFALYINDIEEFFENRFYNTRNKELFEIVLLIFF